MKFFRTKISSWQILALILILFLAGFLTFYLIYEVKPRKVSFQSPAVAIQNSSRNSVQNLPTCVSEERPLKVRGDSLSGLIEDGAVLKILMGYYKCHPVERDDIIIYNYPGGDPLVKIAKGVEGDKFQLKKSATGCGWNILINNKILENSQNSPYCLGEQGYRMLSLYEKDYKGVIPQNAYLILGNSTGGTLDSTRFGLVDKSDFLGKAVK